MLGRLDFLLFLCLIARTVNSEDEDLNYSQLNYNQLNEPQSGCICGNGDSSFISANGMSSSEVREKRATADDLIAEINNLLGNNSTFANLTAQVLGNLTAGNLSQILDEVSTATNTTTPLTSTVPLNTTTSTIQTTVPTSTSTSTMTSTVTSTSSSSTSTVFTTTTVFLTTSTNPSNSTNSSDITSFGVCGTSTFTSNTKKSAQIMSYVASGWVLFWLLLTVLINLCCRAVGVERFLDFLQEAALMVAFVFMGFFVLRPNWSGMCRATQIVLHASMCFVLAVAVMQSLASATINRGCTPRLNACLTFFYIVLPFIVTAGFTCGVYFPLDDEYDNNGVHCFVQIYSKLYWTFSIPFAILLFVAIFINQLGVTACSMQRENVNERQLFWARKTARGLPVLILFFGFCFFTLLFAIDMQLIWLLGVYVGLCALFGPMVFVYHTYCYPRTAAAMWRMKLCCYRPCPEPLTIRTEEIAPLNEMIMQTTVEPVEYIPQPNDVIPVYNPPPVTEFEVINPPDNFVGPVTNVPVQQPVMMQNNTNAVEETSPEEFYNWVTHPSNERAENVLFKRP
ncbi:hypothetical protein M3Y97_00750600 [Aphelenchoides bicaudatus]|nr:hypothetical protein M3Y97_00750600 [Aphelenchoides bicaudatus]